MTAIPKAFSGVLAPVLTPFTADLEPDAARFVRICRWLLDEGAVVSPSSAPPARAIRSPPPNATASSIT